MLTGIVKMQHFDDVKGVLEVSRDAVFIIFDEKIVYANQQAVKLLGYDNVEELLGRWSVENIPENRKALFKPAGKNTPFRYELRIRQKDGEFVDVETQISIIEYQGRPAFLLFTRDFSERRAFEAELNALHKHAVELRLFESVENVLQSTMKTLRETLGFKKVSLGVLENKQIIFKEYQGSYGARNLDLDGPGFTEIAARTGETQCENDLKGKTLGQSRVRSELDVPIIVNRDVFGVVKVECEEVNAFDENDRKLLELLTEHIASSISILREKEKLQESLKELEANNRELDEYTYAVSHDLKAPLRTIQAFSDFLLDSAKEKLDEGELDYLHRIVNASVRMTQLIDDLLVLSRVGRKYLEVEFIDLNNMLNAIVQDLDSLISEKKAKVTFKDLPILKGHKVWLRQLFTNLIGNGLKFNTSKTPKVWVQYEDYSKYHKFSIRDNGIGIDEKNYTRIFRLFERLHTQEEFPGSGAGLTICKKIVESYGGRIWVEGKMGEGSTFFFTIQKGLFDGGIDGQLTHGEPELDIVSDSSM
jgi:PAS domain S-box-containing protein